MTLLYLLILIQFQVLTEGKGQNTQTCLERVWTEGPAGRRFKRASSSSSKCPWFVSFSSVCDCFPEPFIS